MLKIFIVLLFSILQDCNCYQELCANLDSQTGKISENCLKQLRIACNKTELIWTMYDASSKYPFNGMSYSSGYDYGNFDECMSVNYKDNNSTILGKYCFCNMVVVNHNQTAIKERNMEILEDLKANNSMLKSFLSICVPDQCTPQELGASYIINNINGLNISYLDMGCTTIETYQDYDAGEIVFIIVLAIILLLIVISTIYDIYLYYSDNETQHPILLSFSYLTNGRNLLRFNQNTSGQIPCLNGLRFFSTMWIIAYRTELVSQSTPVVNQPFVEEWLSKLYSQYLVAGNKSVETFFFLFTLFLMYGYLQANLETDVKVQIRRIPILILQRYLTITPPLAMVYFTVITIFKKFGTGPSYSMIVRFLEKPCKKYWYSFFLYVQNYVNYDNMCLVHTWYLSADMQMFVLTPIILIPTTVFYQNHFKGVLIGLGIVTIICTLIPLITILTGYERPNDYNTDDRFVDYVIGMIAGLILFKTKDKPYLFTKLQNRIIWIVVLIIWLFVYLYNHEILENPDQTKRAFYNGLFRPIWCICLTWLVYSCHSGYGGFINWLLSGTIFQVCSKLSYCMYVLHYPVVIYSTGIMRDLNYFSDYAMFYSYWGHFVISMILGIIWTLSFEIPFVKIDNLLLGSGGGPMKKES